MDSANRLVGDPVVHAGRLFWADAAGGWWQFWTDSKGAGRMFWTEDIELPTLTEEGARLLMDGDRRTAEF